MFFRVLCFLDRVVVSDLMFIGLLLKQLIIVLSRCWLRLLNFFGFIFSICMVVWVMVWLIWLVVLIWVQLCIWCNSWLVMCGVLCECCVILVVFLVVQLMLRMVVEWCMIWVSFLGVQNFSWWMMLKWLCSGVVSRLVCVVVLIRVNGGRLILIEWVVGFLLIMMLIWKFFIVGYSIFLIMGDRWWILLMNSILCGCRLVSSVVRLLVFLIIGFDVICSVMFSLLVIMWFRVVLFSLGGLKISMWLSVLLCFLVVLMQIDSCLCIGVWLRQLVMCLGWMLVLVVLFLWVVLVLMMWLLVMV